METELLKKDEWNCSIFYRDKIWNITVWDLDIIKEVFVDCVYDDLWAWSIKEWDVIFDIWSNIWAFTLKYWELNKTWERHLFEPIVENFSVLEKNIRINDLNNVVPLNIWLEWGKKGLELKQMYLSNFNTWGHSTVKLWTNPIQRGVRFMWIDTYIAKNWISHINYAKIDCEWWEFELLLHSPLFMSRLVRAWVEVHYFEWETYDLWIDSLLDEVRKYNFVVSIERKDVIPNEWVFYLIYLQKNG